MRVARLARCSTPYAPWYIVPANHKWFRNLAIAEAIVEALQPFRERSLALLEGPGAGARRELEKVRAAGAIRTRGQA